MNDTEEQWKMKDASPNGKTLSPKKFTPTDINDAIYERIVIVVPYKAPATVK
jgi:hypothetical protein